MIPDLRNMWKRYFDDVAVWALHLNAGCRKCLRCFQTVDYASDTTAVRS